MKKIDKKRKIMINKMRFCVDLIRGRIILRVKTEETEVKGLRCSHLKEHWSLITHNLEIK